MSTVPRDNARQSSAYNYVKFRVQFVALWRDASQYLGKVEGVELELLSLLKGHDLYVEGPGREVAIGNGVEQVSDSIIWVGGS